MLLIALSAVVLFIAAYKLYGGWLTRVFDLSATAATPATTINDGEDYVPTRPAVLLGQHFSAIAAVGPIAGPILAGMQYGWLPGLLWILLGTVFIGAVHDFSCLIVSVRHGARSIGDVFKLYVGKNAAALFSLFIWLSLIYVIVVFTDLTASAFISHPELGEANFGPGVATSSLLYLVLGVLMGIALYKFKWPLGISTAIFIPLIFASIWLGQKMPISFPGDALTQQRTWDIIILVYCFVASIIPVWVLLQSRGYLGGFILYATFAVGVLGLLFGKHSIEFPALGSLLPAGGPPLFPLLFTTIACGACSGFHGLVSSGTTAKQLRAETDAQTVGYGGMLLEGLVAVVAMSTLMLQARGSSELALGPDEIYARGLAHFMEPFGLPFAAGVTFGKLAFATFIYDTLDVATRLGRYILEELLGLQGRGGALLGTVLTLIVPVVCIFTRFEGPNGQPLALWKIFWPAFGASNQLLAALSLAGITVWLKSNGRKWWVSGIPAVFMTIITYISLFLIIIKAFGPGRGLDPVGITGLVLICLATYILVRTARAFYKAV